MASYFNLTLRTIAPAGASLTINGGAAYTNTTAVTLAIGTSDTPTTGYTMKIWGINGVATEAAAQWETFAATKSVNLTTGDGLKTVYLKVRDNVYNESAAVSKTITLNTSVPIATITGPDVSVISKITGKDTASFSFMVNEAFDEYSVRIVPATTSLHTAGTQIPSKAGSTNMSGTKSGGFQANTAINCTIKGADLETASNGDGLKIVKIFAKNMAGSWSVT